MKALTQKGAGVRSLCVSAIMLALATVLSFAKIVQFPWGGAITLASMLPIVFVSLAYGIPHGLTTAFVYACVQLFVDLGSIMSWGLTSTILVWTVILDYLLPFTVLGLAGMLGSKGYLGRLAGISVAIALRYLSHVLSGAVLWHSAGKIWEGLEIANEWMYSLVYNGCYMLPELVITVFAAAFLLKNKSFVKLLGSTSDS